MKTLGTTALVLLLPLCLIAQIQYHDIHPDTLLTAQRGTIAEYDLDMDEDGTVDFYFKHFNLDVDWNHLEAYTNYGQPGEVRVLASRTPVPLQHMEEISSSGQWVCTASGSSSSALFMEARWCGAGDRYMGLRFRRNGDWHYGWIRINAAADTTGMVIKDFAWETQANSAILAGDGGTTDLEELHGPHTISMVQQGRYISIKAGDGGRLHTVVYDLLGVQRLERSGFERITMDLSALPHGIYILRMKTGAGVHVRRIVL
ncbi:MAG: hypothetical protein C0600_04325 [Ignavibacteria bacterium]|nr:MAG: hypothetical protein C0600_04325 [Ignavibacteria bacterium]